jgi:aspartyl protease family protein
MRAALAIVTAPMDHLWNASLAYKVVLVAVLIASFVTFARSSNMRIATIARYASIWILIAFVIAAAYTLRDDAKAFGERMLADLMPSHGMASGPNGIVFRAANDGHFHVDAVVDGKTIEMMVDTGATLVSLSRRDAARIGIDLTRLAYTQRVMTANGPALSAPVTLRELRVGPITLANVHAAVSEERAEGSLLGMSFLGRLQSYTVQGDKLALTAR